MPAKGSTPVWDKDTAKLLADAVAGPLKMNAICDDFGANRATIRRVLTKFGYPSRRVVRRREIQRDRLLQIEDREFMAGVHA